MDDQEILAQLKAGDMSACKACVESHSDGLYRLAYRILRDEAAAEDVVQDTFLNAFKALDQFDGRSTLGTWLFRIAYNNALMRLRRNKPAVSLDANDDDPALGFTPVVLPWRETPEDVIARQEIRELLEQAIAALPESLYTVFQLRDIEERSTAETAQIVGLSEAAVKVRLHRARLLLREKLSGYFGEPGELAASGMTCEQLLPYLSDYIDNTADAPLAAAARAHIVTCPHCHVLLDTTLKTITLLSNDKPRVIPTADREHLFGEIRAAFQARKQRFSAHG
jgi:RNA polymerase sigma-70 factor (ECF subfamily)